MEGRQMIVRDMSQEKEQDQKLVISTSIDGHPTRMMKRAYNSSVMCILYCAFLDLVFMIWYADAVTVCVILFLSLFNVLFNLLWILMPQRLRMGTMSGKRMFAFYVFQSLLFAFHVGAFVYYFVTLLDYDLYSDYYWTDMWVFTNLFLMTTAAFNVVQVYSFVRHVYWTQKFMSTLLK